MRLNERQILILRQLLLKNQIVNLAELSAQCNCSAKTVQRDLEKIEEAGKELNFELKRIRGQGVELNCDSAVRVKLNELVFQNEKLNGTASVEDRRNRIYLELLLNAPYPTNIRQLSEKYFVSSSSIVNDLTAIEERAMRNGLRMKRTREGTSLEGTEVTIRNEAARMLNEIKPEGTSGFQDWDTRLNQETRRVLEGIYGKKNVGLVEEYIQKIEDNIHVMLGDIYYVNIVTHTLIAIERIRNKKFIEEELILSEKDCNQLIYDKIKECMEQFSGEIGISIPDNEIQYMYIHFTGCGMGELPSKEVITQILDHSNQMKLNFCDELVAAMEEKMEILFSTDTNLVYSLFLHVNSMLNRIVYNVRISCPLGEKTRQDYPEMYECVKQVTLKLAEKYFPGKQLSEDELSYLCLYFQMLFSEAREPENVLIVCSTGVGIAHVLKRRVQNTFPDLNIVDVLSVRQLRNRDLTGIGMILATVKIDFEVDCKVVYVSALLDQNDISEIKKIMK